VKVDIDDAIFACKVLKKSSLHTDNFWGHHAQLTVLYWLKKMGFKSVSLISEEDEEKSQ